MPVDVALGGAIALHLLEAIAVAQQLEVLPRREQQHQHQDDADAERLPEILQPPIIDLAHDLVVAEVLANLVFEGSCFIHGAPLTCPAVARSSERRRTNQHERRRAAWRCARADLPLPRHPMRRPDAWSALSRPARLPSTVPEGCVSPPGLQASETKSGPSVLRA